MRSDRQKAAIFTAAAAAVIGICSLGAVMAWQNVQERSCEKWRHGMEQEWSRKGENIWIFTGFCQKGCIEFEYKLESALEEGWILRISDRTGTYWEEWSIRPGTRKIQCLIPDEMFLKICVFNENPKADGREGEFYIREVEHGSFADAIRAFHRK